jgi:hypothetical protein
MSFFSVPRWQLSHCPQEMLTFFDMLLQYSVDLGHNITKIIGDKLLI